MRACGSGLSALLQGSTGVIWAACWSSSCLAKALETAELSEVSLCKLAWDTCRMGQSQLLWDCVSVSPPSEGAVLSVGCHFESQKTPQVALPGSLVTVLMH